ncbi:AraC family transcriptional regulator [Lichenifustis flavocetrariae]|uniref:AraC family transcriptional regulator n=1 Tax=Lichenifustis flavocetrariae TaxID=2949735 RepID=A0AA41YU95_9HYPH|nr:AraC family transcriptional regulator [Lichenifustis flavocetrariae]MCW6508274.1 AraC family transcriptional regulator [Lichenifustis flavocetrariae]
MGNPELLLLKALAPVMSTVSVPRGRRRLHTMPTSCGYEIRHDEPYHWNGLRRGQTPFTVLQHTVAGAGNLLYGRRRYRLEAGDTMLVIVPHNHRYWLEAGGSWEYFWLSTTGQEAVAIQRDILAVAGPVFRLQERTIEHLAGCCRRLIESRAEAPGMISAMAYEALMALYDDVLFRSHEAEPGGDGRVAKIVRHIRAHLAQPLDIPGLAALAGLSRTQFTRVFTAQEGLPPAEFILRERMTQAARLLGRAETRIGEVAKACGFDDPNYFAKVFRRTFGISPTEFRTTGMYSSALRSGSGNAMR